MSLMMGLSKVLSGEYGYFTFLQIFLIGYGISLLIWTVLWSYNYIFRGVAYVMCFCLLFANPVILNRISQIYPETLLALGLIILSILYCKVDRLSAKGFCFYALVVLLLTVGMRYNALPVVLPLVLLIAVRIGFCRSRPRLISSMLVCYVLILGVFIYNLPRIMNMSESNNLAYIVLWDYVGITLETKHPESTYALKSILPIDKARAIYSPQSLASFQWQEDRIPDYLIAEHENEIFLSFGALILNNPTAFLRHRIKRVLGLLTLDTIKARDGPFEVQDYSKWGEDTPNDINFEPVDFRLINWMTTLYYRPNFHWLYKPPFAIGVASLLVLPQFLLRVEGRFERIILFLAIAYYLTFAIFTPEISFRYFFTSYLLLTAVSWIASAKLVHLLFLTLVRRSSRHLTFPGRSKENLNL